jgi:hypothetical protein
MNLLPEKAFILKRRVCKKNRDPSASGNPATRFLKQKGLVHFESPSLHAKEVKK